jgi:hypothetical protein
MVWIIIDFSHAYRTMIVYLSYFIVQHLLDKRLLITVSNIEIKDASIRREVLINDFCLTWHWHITATFLSLTLLMLLMLLLGLCLSGSCVMGSIEEEAVREGSVTILSHEDVVLSW